MLLLVELGICPSEPFLGLGGGFWRYIGGFDNGGTSGSGRMECELGLVVLVVRLCLVSLGRECWCLGCFRPVGC